MQKSYLYLCVLMAVAPAWAQTSPAINTFPTREFGQPQLLPTLNSIAPNLVEGREVYQPSGIAFDTSVTPPIMYIADSGNNRVIAYQNPSTLGVCTVNNSTCGFASSVVLGQRDLTSTLSGGPGGQGLSYGFSYPTSVAVDSKGNVYVVDSGNNRILRFPTPFKQTGALLTPDLIIGQTSLSGNSPNQGQPLPSAQTLWLASGSTALRTGIAVEPATGGLWVTDPFNNRVLRFPASQLAANTIAPTADIVLGQNNFTTGTLPTPPTGIQAPLAMNILYQPAALVFDQTGNLYVSDYYNRVLYFVGPFGSGTVGLSATRVLGLYVQLQGSTLVPPNQYSLLGPPGLAVNSTNHLFVADFGYNRIGEYDVPANWPAAPPPTQSPVTSQFSPPMIAVIGQNNQFAQVKANQGNASPSNATVSSPFALGFLGTDLWVVDTGNNRVTSFVLQGTSYVTASRLVGQLDFPYNAPNLIEGREVFLGGAGGVAIDHSSTAPHLYIADTFNNRILGFNDARNIQPGQKADLVLGQTDFYSSLVNSPTNIATEPTQTGLFRPIGVVVDSAGNLYVSDSGNGRVVRYPAPFNQPAGSTQLPNLVLGQASFNSSITDASANNMHTPYGIALFIDGSLGVSDFFHNRVLIFKKASGAADFSNGQAASIVLGQQTTTSTGASTAAAGMTAPAHIAVDTSNRLYVADSGNNRMLVFNSTTNLATGATSSNQFLNFSTPLGIAVSSITGEIWISNYGSNLIYRLPEYDTLILNSTPTTYPTTATIQPQTAGLALALDDADNLIVAENANRITFFYAQLVYSNAANYNSAPIAPGMLVLLARVGLSLQITNGSAQTLPWKTTLNDVQVAVNGVPAPIYAISAGYISIQVPSSTPSSGNATFIVSHPSTGEIIAVGSFPMQQFSPGFFTQGALGVGQIAAVNDDGTVNSASNQVSRDGTHFISFYLTGGGVFSGGPNPPPTDGAAPTQTASTAIQPQILAAAYAGQVPAADILYSGAGGGYPGLWQVSMKVTTTFAPSAQQVVTLIMNGVATSTGPNGTIATWFATK